MDLLINQAKSGKEMSVNNLTALESGLQQIVNMLDEVKEYIDEVVVSSHSTSSWTDKTERKGDRKRRNWQTDSTHVGDTAYSGCWIGEVI